MPRRVRTPRLPCASFPARSRSRPAEPEHRRAPTPPEIAPEDRAGAAEIAAAIEDSELRETVARAAAASLARSRSGAGSDRGF